MNAESRPEAALEVIGATKVSLSQMGSPSRIRTDAEELELRELALFLGGCRRRREDAADRLPPLADGRRDPLRAPSEGGACS
jgi:hypothetical protein